jgi:hypothetical protein
MVCFQSEDEKSVKKRCPPIGNNESTLPRIFAYTDHYALKFLKVSPACYVHLKWKRENILKPLEVLLIMFYSAVPLSQTQTSAIVH